MTILSYASLECDITIGYVYLWTNNFNGKRYIGSHNGSNPDYTASGVAIRRAFLKYGIENFTRTFLYVGPRYREVELEMLLSIDARRSDNYYNQINFMPEGVTGSGDKNPMYGKTHSEETRMKMSLSKMGQKRPPMEWLIGVPRPETSNKKTGTTMLIRWHEKGAHKEPRDGCPNCTLAL